MPRNFSELKSGGDNSYAAPHPEKCGGGTRPPVPHRSTPVNMLYNCVWIHTQAHTHFIVHIHRRAHAHTNSYYTWTFPKFQGNEIDQFLGNEADI